MTPYPRHTRVFTRDHDRVLDAGAFFDELNGPTPFGGMFCPDRDRLPDQNADERIRAAVAAIGSARYDHLALSVVVPQAGSLRGGPGNLLDRWLDTVAILASHLDAHGAKTEVIGYTTTTWKGGRSIEDWKAAGRPELPGRLCDLLHVVYKAFDQGWGDEDRHLFDLGARSGFLRENVDGEAIDFAAARLVAQEREHKVLVVFDKLVAMDDATASFNGPAFLEIDRQAAIDHARRTGIALVAVADGGRNRAKFPSMFHPGEIAYAKSEDDYASEDAAREILKRSRPA